MMTTRALYPILRTGLFAALLFAAAACDKTTPPVTPSPPPPPNPVVATITVTPPSASVEASKSVQLDAVARDAAGAAVAATLTWSSGDTALATVSSTGLVTAKAMGPVTITAASGSVSANASLNITRQLFDHVFIVWLENRDYTDVIGHASMPYLNNLAQQYALATEFYANQHPSVGNYLMFTVGDSITDNGSFNGTITNDNVIRRLLAAGKTWKSYAENLPSTGYVGGDQGLYARRHNPFVWLSDVKDDLVQRQNIVNYSQFAGDLAANRLPQYVYIEPNLCDDGHDCANDIVNNWLAANIEPILQSAAFANSVLILTYDEAVTTSTRGGGRIPFMVISPRAKRGYRSTTVYQFESALRLSLELLGVTSIPGAGNGAPTMWEFFSR